MKRLIVMTKTAYRSRKVEMKKTSEVKVVQGEEPMPVEIIADHIKTISEGMKKLLNGPLNEKALFLLIQNAAPTFRNGRKISLTEISTVIEGIESLEKTYLRDKKQGG
jgi:hypothetical protein